MNKANIFFMTGDDAFSMREEMQRWKQAFLEKFGDSDLEEWDGESLAGESVEVGALKCALCSLPFLSEKRLVIMKNFLSSRPAGQANELLHLLEKIPDTTVLLLVEYGTPDARSTIYKALSKEATKRLFLKPKGAQLSTWMRHRAGLYGASLSSEAATVLASGLGDNLFTLDNEISKLCLFAKARLKNTITIEMIDEIVTRGTEKSIFTMTDQLSRKDFTGVLRTIRDLQDKGEDAAFIFSMITRQFRLMLEMKALSDENLSAPMIAKKMNIHPFIVQNTLRFARNFTEEELKSALRRFLVIDERLKSGLIPLKPHEQDHYLLAIERELLFNEPSAKGL